MFKYTSILVGAGACMALTGCKSNSDGGKDTQIKNTQDLVKKYAELSKQATVSKEDLEKLYAEEMTLRFESKKSEIEREGPKSDEDKKNRVVTDQNLDRKVSEASDAMGKNKQMCMKKAGVITADPLTTWPTVDDRKKMAKEWAEKNKAAMDYMWNRQMAYIINARGNNAEVNANNAFWDEVLVSPEVVSDYFTGLFAAPGAAAPAEPTFTYKDTPIEL